jgi:hypothetical protein
MFVEAYKVPAILFYHLSDLPLVTFTPFPSLPPRGKEPEISSKIA